MTKAGKSKLKHKQKKQKKQKPSIAKSLQPWWKDKNPVLLFILGFIVIISVLYVGKVFIDQGAYKPLLQFNAQIAHHILSIFGLQTSVSEATISSDRFTMSVVTGCDATDAVMIFLAVVLAFPARWKDKLIGCLVGTAFLLIVNVFRVIVLFLVGTYYHDWFEVMHIEIMQFVFILLALACFALWIKWTYRKKPLKEPSDG